MHQVLFKTVEIPFCLGCSRERNQAIFSSHLIFCALNTEKFDIIHTESATLDLSAGSGPFGDQ